MAGQAIRESLGNGGREPTETGKLSSCIDLNLRPGRVGSISIQARSNRWRWSPTGSVDAGSRWLTVEPGSGPRRIGARVPAVGVNPWGPQPRRSRVERTAQAPGSAVGVAGGGQARDPGSSTTSDQTNHAQES